MPVIVTEFNATFNNISVILWLSVLFVEETGVPWENHWILCSELQYSHRHVISLLTIHTCIIRHKPNDLYSYFLMCS